MDFELPDPDIAFATVAAAVRRLDGLAAARGPLEDSTEADVREARSVLRHLADANAEVLYEAGGALPVSDVLAEFRQNGVSDAALKAATKMYDPTHDARADLKVASKAVMGLWFGERNGKGAQRAEASRALDEIRLFASPILRDHHYIAAYVLHETDSAGPIRREPAGPGRSQPPSRGRLTLVRSDADDAPVTPMPDASDGESPMSESLELAVAFASGHADLHGLAVGPDGARRDRALVHLRALGDELAAVVVDPGRYLGVDPATTALDTLMSHRARLLQQQPSVDLRADYRTAREFTTRLCLTARNHPRPDQQVVAANALDELRSLTSARPTPFHWLQAAMAQVEASERSADPAQPRHLRAVRPNEPGRDGRT